MVTTFCHALRVVYHCLKEGSKICLILTMLGFHSYLTLPFAAVFFIYFFIYCSDFPLPTCCHVKYFELIILLQSTKQISLCFKYSWLIFYSFNLDCNKLTFYTYWLKNWMRMITFILSHINGNSGFLVSDISCFSWWRGLETVS